jgi:hypothetical protein
MSVHHARRKAAILGALTATLAACVAGGGGYDGAVDVGYVGGFYDPCCWDYGGWGGGYYYGPPRGEWHGGGWHGGDGRGGGWRGGGGHVGRGVPSIPSHPRGR